MSKGTFTWGVICISITCFGQSNCLCHTQDLNGFDWLTQVRRMQIMSCENSLKLLAECKGIAIAIKTDLNLSKTVYRCIQFLVSLLFFYFYRSFSSFWRVGFRLTSGYHTFLIVKCQTPIGQDLYSVTFNDNVNIGCVPIFTISARNVYYRFLVLAVNIGTQPPLCIVAQLFFHIQYLRNDNVTIPTHDTDTVVKSYEIAVQESSRSSCKFLSLFLRIVQGALDVRQG